MSTTSIGRDAEELVAQKLQADGHKIVSLNWRTRWCEIDIVSTNKKCAYFTEVKYRGSNDWGGGLEYITKKKLRQMKFAAEFWLSDNKWKGESILQAAEVDSTNSINLVEL
jgi:uncharacterized protein (TIGR00252 family)